MCKQSTKILQGYLTELLSTTEKISADTFANSELKVTVVPLHNSIVKRKSRITKEQRCSLLKRLLLSKSKKKPSLRKHRKRNRIKEQQGGLRNIIQFTRTYDFGYKLDCKTRNSNLNIESPLAKLANFTKSFFLHNFADFRNTILYIIENKDTLSDSDDEDEMFDNYTPEPGEDVIKCEEVVVEPDIKIKTEFDYDECETSYSCNYYVETSYESEADIKKENMIDIDDMPLKQEPLDYLSNHDQQQNSMQLLDKLVGNLGHDQHKRPFSQHSVRCRTRGNPYINPKLKQQFQFKSFVCEKCNRYFKSPGYLKAHISKIHS